MGCSRDAVFTSWWRIIGAPSTTGTFTSLAEDLFERFGSFPSPEELLQCPPQTVFLCRVGRIQERVMKTRDIHLKEIANFIHGRSRSSGSELEERKARERLGMEGRRDNLNG